MIMALLFVGVIGLFSTGPGGRHDWMRFHADDVPCPANYNVAKLSIPCAGNLKWFGTGRKELRCDVCLRKFTVKEKKTK